MDPEGFDTKKITKTSQNCIQYTGKPRLFFIHKRSRKSNNLPEIGGDREEVHENYIYLYIYIIHIYNITQLICLDSNPLNSLELSFSMCFFFRCCEGPRARRRVDKKVPTPWKLPRIFGVYVSGGSGWVRDTSFSRLFSLSTQNWIHGFRVYLLST